MSIDKIRAAIRDVPDFPKPGIVFKDITPVLANPDLFRLVLDIFETRVQGRGITKIAAIDARGFLFGGALADRMKVGLVPIRKAGKLPYKTYEESYALEYGEAKIAIHRDAFGRDEKVLLIDDLLATGGTAAAAARLVEKAGGSIVEIGFLIELTFLEGRKLLNGYEVFSPIAF